MDKEDLLCIIAGTLFIGGLLNLFFVVLASISQNDFFAFQTIVFAVGFSVSALIVEIGD